MKTTIKATNFEHTPAIDAYVLKRVASFEKFLDTNDESILCQVEIGKTTNHHKQGDVYRAEINMHVAGKDIYSEQTEPDLYVAIDEVTDEVKRIIKTHRSKQKTLIRRGGALIKKWMRFGRE